MKAVGTEPDAAVCDEDEGDGGAVAPLLPDQTLQTLVAIEQYYFMFKYREDGNDMMFFIVPT